MSSDSNCLADNPLVDVIEFRRRRPYPSYVVDIVVNERLLSKLIGEIEIRSEVGRKPSIVG